VLLAVVLFLVVLCLVVVRLHPGGTRAGRGVDDLGQLLNAPYGLAHEPFAALQP